MYDDMVSAPETGSAVLSAMPAANDELPAAPDDERARVQAIADRLARGITGRHHAIPRPDGWRLNSSPDEPEAVYEGNGGATR